MRRYAVNDSEREYYAFAAMVRQMSVSIWQAASIGDTERVMEETACLTKQAADRMLKMEGQSLPTEESDYDLMDLRKEFGDTPDTP